MTPLRSLFALLALTAPLTLLAQALPNQGTLDSIVAIVEEDVVLRSELESTVDNVRRQFAEEPSQLPPAHILERQVLERLIMGRLQLMRAESSGIRVSEAELDAAVSRVAAGNNMTIGQLRMALEADGFNYEEFRQTLRDELIIDALRNRVVRSEVEVSDTEIDIAMAANDGSQGEVRLAHILVSIPEGASAEQIRVGREKADGIIQLINDGMDFAAAAIRYSDGPQALEGGDLGWRRIDQVPPGFAEQVESMEVGEISAPQRAPGGFHILQLAEKREQGQFIVSEFNALHLLIRSSEVVTPNRALQRLLAARQRILDGEDFRDVARDVSEDESSAALGGDLGWFPIAAYGQGVAMALEQIDDGQMSEPFQSAVGWHIVKRVGTRERDRTTEMMREQARDSIFQRKAQEAYESWLRQLRAEAYVENRLADNS